MKLTAETALVLVDVQRDFLPGGARLAPRGEEIVARARRMAEGFAAAGLTIVAARDWHPTDHASFQAQGGSWPPHAVQGTPGAEFAPDLALPERAWIVSKGEQPDAVAPSAFAGTDLAERLEQAKIQSLCVCGLGTEWGVRATVLEALERGFEVVLVADACRSFDAHATASARAVEDMLRAGARVASSGAVDNALEAYTPAG